MNQQKIMWFVLFLLGVSMVFYKLVTDVDRKEKIVKLEEKDDSLTGKVTEKVELYKRFDLRLIGHSKHLQNIQDETDAHYRRYSEKMDSLDNALDVINFNIEHLDETLTKRIDKLKSSLSELSDLFDSYKRTTNNSIYGLKTNVADLKSDVEANSSNLIRIMNLESIKKKLEKESAEKE